MIDKPSKKKGKKMKELRKEQFGGSNYAEYENGELVKRHQLNKRELRMLQDEIRKSNAESQATPAKKTTSVGQVGQRYLELASRSVGLNTGKAWVCDLSTVERTSCPPEWEGLLVCYVYPE